MGVEAEMGDAHRSSPSSNPSSGAPAHLVIEVLLLLLRLLKLRLERRHALLHLREAHRAQDKRHHRHKSVSSEYQNAPCVASMRREKL